MCGIFGYIRWNGKLPPQEHLRRATNLLRHRGPDSGGYWCEGPAFIGHRRLAIIDPRPCGRQPMASASGRYVLTFNGEIYNYLELRDELRARGCVFHTDSDTEVILAAYETWGEDAASHLLGMYAFGIYDRRQQSVYLARDRFGEKPLLVWSAPGLVAFASELAPLTALPEAPRVVDADALGGYLALNYVPGDATMVDGIRRVPPGTWQRFGPQGLETSQRYWSLPSAGARPRSIDEASDAFQQRLDESIAIALRSDVPVGLFLSGGVDSSLIAESAARQGKLSTAFCVDMEDAGFSEWSAATAVAARLGLHIERVPCSSAVLEDFLDVVAHADDPLADSSAMAVWTVAKAASRSVKVVLGGDGGDELFAGYLTYAASRWHANARWLPAAMSRGAAALSKSLPADTRRKVSASYKMQRFLRALPLPTGEAHFTWNGTWLPDEAAALVTSDSARAAARSALKRLASRHGTSDDWSLDALQRADLSDYLPNDILSKVDRMTMAHGVESRAPFLHPEIAALALSLPINLRVSPGGRTKVLLRHVCARHFGDAHANAPKQGFSIPIHAWLRGPARTLATSLLAPDRVIATGVLDPVAVAAALNAHLAGRQALGWEIWGLMVFVAWFEARLARPPRLADLPDAELEPLRITERFTDEAAGRASLRGGDNISSP